VRWWSPLLLSLLSLGSEALADAKETLDAARAAYYSLRREGLASFTCLVTPNWDTVLGSKRRSDPIAAEKAYKLLNGLTFGVEAAPARRAKVMHTDPAGASEQENAGLKLVVHGVEQTLSGFFDIWNPWVMTSAIPPSTAEVIETQGRWNIDHKDGGLRIAMVMRKDYTVDLLQLTTEKYDSVIQPQFTRSPKGLLLTAVQGEYKPLPSGTAASLQVRIQYQTVSGFQLPRRVHVSAIDKGEVVLMDLSFGTCQAQRRP
jgi:hypothetical protein